MSDLPSTRVFLARPRAPGVGQEDLEVLGKRAAAVWSSGEQPSLSAAVKETVKLAHLSTEQVRRVIEFANTEAFLCAFQKEGQSSRLVDFPGGPADPSVVLADLNAGPAAPVVDRGLADYEGPPPARGQGGAKLAHAAPGAAAADEAAFAACFGYDAGLPEENPYAEALALRDKLAGAAEHVRSTLSGLELLYDTAGERLSHEVKQAALGGVTLGQVLQAWRQVTCDSEAIKVAFARVTPTLLEREVFPSVEAMHASLEKQGHARQVVNPAHPLVGAFADFVEALTKVAEHQALWQELAEVRAPLEAYLAKEASAAGRAVRTVTRGAKRVADAVAPAVETVAGPAAGKLTHGAIQYAPHAGAALLGMEAYTHAKHSPHPVAQGARAAYHGVLRNVPGTSDRYQHIYEVQNGL